MSSANAGSRLDTGSSANRMVGSWAMARAMATRCCSPPDSVRACRSFFPSRWTSWMTWSQIRRSPSAGTPNVLRRNEVCASRP